MTDVATKARTLYEARRTRVPIPPFTDAEPDNPVAVVAWLANALGEHGVALEPGHLILTGALHAAVPLTPDDVFRAEFDRLGPVTVRVS
jgi:2-keto-4-pentenoate hydratase